MCKIAASLDFGEMRLSGYYELAWERSSKLFQYSNHNLYGTWGTLIKGTFDYE